MASKKTAGRYAVLFERLVRETHEMYRATGHEEAQDVIRKQVQEAMVEVWPDYLRREVEKTYGLEPEPKGEDSEE